MVWDGAMPTDDRPRTAPPAAPLPPATAAAVRALAGRAAEADGVPPLSEQPLLWLTGAEQAVVHLLVGAPAGDGLRGYAQVDLRDPDRASAELVVDPGHRRRGTGSALLRAVADATRSAGGASVGVWAHGDLPAARATADRLGLPVVRELWQMRLSPLTLPPVRALPDGVTVRAFVPGRDEDAWVALNARAFAAHPEQGRLTRADLELRMAEPWFDPAGLLLAERDGRLLASGWTKVPPGSTEGEVYALGVDPDAQGQGLGRALTARMLVHLAGRGMTSAVLYTEGDNLPAVAVYRAAGFARSAVDVVYRA